MAGLSRVKNLKTLEDWTKPVSSAGDTREKEAIAVKMMFDRMINKQEKQSGTG